MYNFHPLQLALSIHSFIHSFNRFVENLPCANTILDYTESLVQGVLFGGGGEQMETMKKYKARYLHIKVKMKESYEDLRKE